MLIPTLLTSLLATLSSAIPTAECTSERRIDGAKQIVYAYSVKDPVTSLDAFNKVPFGPKCYVAIHPNGLPPVPVAFTGKQTTAFADATRQVFHDITGQYVNFKNGTTDLMTNVTLGAGPDHEVEAPVTFFAHVYLTYNLKTCQIYDAQAFANIPTRVLGQVIHPPGFNLPPPL